MPANNVILNRFFTQNVFSDLIYAKDSSVYCAVVRRYIREAKGKDNGELIREIYGFLAKSYRNEYFYQNTLLNKLLLGKHSLRTTTALTQIPIGRSIADFILINGRAVVYEIKTELDSLDRLDAQLEDYYKAFSRVCVVTSEKHYDRIMQLTKDSAVGVYILTKQNTISSTMGKDPSEDNSKLNHKAIFKILHKMEYENVIMQYYKSLPIVSQVFYYTECLKWFLNIPMFDVQRMVIKQLKKRNKTPKNYFNDVPYELKCLMYFSKLSEVDWRALNDFLREKYGG